MIYKTKKRKLKKKKSKSNPNLKLETKKVGDTYELYLNNKLYATSYSLTEHNNKKEWLQVRAKKDSGYHYDSKLNYYIPDSEYVIKLNNKEVYYTTNLKQAKAKVNEISSKANDINKSDLKIEEIK